MVVDRIEPTKENLALASRWLSCKRAAERVLADKNVNLTKKRDVVRRLALMIESRNSRNPRNSRKHVRKSKVSTKSKSKSKSNSKSNAKSRRSKSRHQQRGGQGPAAASGNPESHTELDTHAVGVVNKRSAHANSGPNPDPTSDQPEQKKLNLIPPPPDPYGHFEKMVPKIIFNTGSAAEGTPNPEDPVSDAVAGDTGAGDSGTDAAGGPPPDSPTGSDAAGGPPPDSPEGTINITSIEDWNQKFSTATLLCASALYAYAMIQMLGGLSSTKISDDQKGQLKNLIPQLFSEENLTLKVEADSITMSSSDPQKSVKISKDVLDRVLTADSAQKIMGSFGSPAAQQ